MTPHLFKFIGLLALLIPPGFGRAQDTTTSSGLGAALADTTAIGRYDLAVSVYGSGVWEVDGEYRSKTGVYYKLTGHFAVVARDKPISEDLEKSAVAAFYLEPMAGGGAAWMGGYFLCNILGSDVICQATEAAGGLLDVYFVVSGLLWRDRELEVEIREPTDQDAEKRYTSRYSVRGKFTLKPLTPQ